jgi:hypothetical protein
MKNIIWLVSYPKSGNTWFRMFLANYLKNSEGPLSLQEIQSASISSSAVDFEDTIGFNPFEMTPEEVDLYRPEMYRLLSKEMEENDLSIYKKTHDAYTTNNDGEPLFPEDVSRCAVYFVRNPLDVCVSFANHSAGKIEGETEFIVNEEATLSGKRNGQLRQILFSWKNHVQSWINQSRIPMLFVRYEDMLQKPLETFGAVVRFLDLEYNEERLQKAIIHSDFKLLQQMEQEKGFGEKMQLCQSFFWKGKIGNYRDFLSQEQIDRITDYNYETMKEFGYIDLNGKLTV